MSRKRAVTVVLAGVVWALVVGFHLALTLGVGGAAVLVSAWAFRLAGVLMTILAMSIGGAILGAIWDGLIGHSLWAELTREPGPEEIDAIRRAPVWDLVSKALLWYLAAVIGLGLLLGPLGLDVVGGQP
jgi:hypothetical protein